MLDRLAVTIPDWTERTCPGHLDHAGRAARLHRRRPQLLPGRRRHRGLPADRAPAGVGPPPCPPRRLPPARRLQRPRLGLPRGGVAACPCRCIRSASRRPERCVGRGSPVIDATHVPGRSAAPPSSSTARCRPARPARRAGAEIEPARRRTTRSSCGAGASATATSPRARPARCSSTASPREDDDEPPRRALQLQGGRRDRPRGDARPGRPPGTGRPTRRTGRPCGSPTCTADRRALSQAAAARGALGARGRARLRPGRHGRGRACCRASGQRRAGRARRRRDRQTSRFPAPAPEPCRA